MPDNQSIENTPRTGLPGTEVIEDDAPPSPPSLNTIRKKHIGIKGIIGRGLLAFFVAKGAGVIPQDVSLNPMDALALANKPSYDFNPPKETVNVETLREDVEKKYDINIYNMSEAFQLLGYAYDQSDPKEIGPRPPVRWSANQLNLLNDVLPFMPSDMISPKDGKKMSIFIGDFGTDCSCGGAYFGNRFTGIQADYVNSSNRQFFFDILLHEGTHEIDDLTNHEVYPKIKQIIGDKTYMSLPEFANNFDQAKLSDEQKGAIMILQSLASDKISEKTNSNESLDAHINFTEGVAEISPIYARGYDLFMNTIGPLLDGNGYPSPNFPSPESSPMPQEATPAGMLEPSATPVEKPDFASLYPKTQQLYELYKTEVFDGKEYDANTIYHIQHSQDDINNMVITQRDKLLHSQVPSSTPQASPQSSEEPSPQSLSSSIEEGIKSLENNYDVEISTDSGKQIESKSMQFLSAALKSFPKSFYTVYGDQKLKIVLTDSVDKLSSHAENTLFLPSVLRSWSSGEPNRYASALFHELIVDNDNATNYQFSDTLTQILGGEEFLKSPEKFYPELKNRNDGALALNFPAYSIFYDVYGDGKVQNKSEMAAKIGDFYLGGWEEMVRSLSPIVDPEFGDYDKWMNSRVDHSNTKLAKIYEAFMQFTGVEFTGNFNNGAPNNFGFTDN